MLTKDMAICIRAVDYSETSQIVTLFTRDTGKIGAIAKGSKRLKSTFDGPIEILSHGQILFADSNKDTLATLTEFQQEPTLLNLRKNLFALYCCYFAAELVNGLIHDYDPHPELFESFLQFLQNAGRHETRHGMLAALILFQLGLLNEIGLQPVLTHCANCKTKYEYRASSIEHQVYFSSSANGLVCRDCEINFADKIRLSKDVATCLTNLKQIPASTEEILAEIEKVMVLHLTELFGRPPRMAKHIMGS
ncbi:MAG: DNA repair protein RecO [Phycisphaerae bacterium]|nr:DNA repair protein RecO [Phycisphaerae bacterium]